MAFRRPSLPFTAVLLPLQKQIDGVDEVAAMVCTTFATPIDKQSGAFPQAIACSC